MSLGLKPDDIDIIEEGGMLDNTPVKLLRSKGGFWLAIHNNKVLTGGSHPAIVKYTISKMYPNFQPVMCKSQQYGIDSVVEKHSHFLPDDLRKSGYDIYSIQNNQNIEFQLTKNNLSVASVSSLLEDNSLFINELKFPKKFTKALAGAATEKALDCKMKKIKVK